MFNKKHGLFDFKASSLLSQLSNKKITHAFAPAPLMFKLQQEIWKFSDVCVSWGLPKTDLETNFLNLENLSFVNVNFENVSFS